MFGGEGGLVICRWGDLGLGRRRRNGGGECRQSGHIFTFADGLTNGFIPSVNTSAKPSVILTGNRHVTARTCFSNPLVIPSVFLTVHRSCHRHGSDISNPSVFLLVNRSHHAYGPQVLNPSVIPSAKSPAKTLAPSTRPFFINSEFSVGNSVGNYRRIFAVGDFGREIPKEEIPSVSPLVFSEFLVVFYHI